LLFSAVSAEIIIPGNIDNTIQYVQRLLVTSDGGQNGSPIADFNTGGNIIFYSPIKDIDGNSYLT
jgi:hypothetical protein